VAIQFPSVEGWTPQADGVVNHCGCHPRFWIASCLMVFAKTEIAFAPPLCINITPVTAQPNGPWPSSALPASLLDYFALVGVRLFTPQPSAGLDFTRARPPVFRRPV